jgi:hypothetical protein
MPKNRINNEPEQTSFFFNSASIDFLQLSDDFSRFYSKNANDQAEKNTTKPVDKNF